MKRREFIKLTSATLFVPTLPSMAKPKTKPMTLEAFCRDVLKVRLYPWQRQWVLYFDRPGRNKANRHLRFEATGHCDIGTTVLAACVAFWAADTHPDRMVWLHGDRKAIDDWLRALFTFAFRPTCKLYSRFYEQIWVWGTDKVYLSLLPRGPKRGDWHIYI